MKRKILATLLALATAGCCALGFTACDGEPETPPEKEPEEITQPDSKGRQLTDEEWKKEINNLKGLGDYKNYTIEISVALTEIGEDEVFSSATQQVDFENQCFYWSALPDEASDGITCYFEAGESYSLGEYTVYDCRELVTAENELELKEYNTLIQKSVRQKLLDCAYKMTMLNNYKDYLDGNTDSPFADDNINIEESYELFTFNEQTNSYTVNEAWITTEHITQLRESQNGYNYLSFNGESGALVDLDITFGQDYVTIKIFYGSDGEYYDNYYEKINIKNINSTKIELPEELQQKLDELQ